MAILNAKGVMMGRLIDAAKKEMAADEFRFDMRKPCDDCPFRKRSKLHGAIAERIPDYVRGLKSGLLGHTCHKTDGRADGPISGQVNNVVQHCAGAMIWQMKCSGNEFPKLITDAIESGLLTETDFLEMARDDDSVFDDEQQMINHYLDLIKAKIGKKDE